MSPGIDCDRSGATPTADDSISAMPDVGEPTEYDPEKMSRDLRVNEDHEAGNG